MKNIIYHFRATEPVHTGSDEKLGTLRTLRREKVLVENPKPLLSRFTDAQKRLKRQAVALLLFRLWNKMGNKSRPTIYEELSSKLSASTAVRTKEEFLQAICAKLEIREVTVDASRRFDVVDILELFDDYELLNLIRHESQYIVSMFRKMKDDTISWDKEVKGRNQVVKNTLFGTTDENRSPEVLISDELEKVLQQPFVEIHQQHRIDYVPVISGNSIRGMLRRLVMSDFLKLAGIESISPEWYHLLFTGGTIDESTGFEDIGKRREIIRICPMLGLFGSAIGNQTLSGTLRVGQAKLMCSEYGKGDLSYHDYLDIIFSTRLDSLKLENELDVEGQDNKTHQMKYEYEVFSVGSKFEHSFACMSDDNIIISAFYRMLRLFIEQPYIVAKGSVGHGSINLGELIDALASLEMKEQVTDEQYLNHIASTKDAIVAYFNPVIHGE